MVLSMSLCPRVMLQSTLIAFMPRHESCTFKLTVRGEAVEFFQWPVFKTKL